MLVNKVIKTAAMSLKESCRGHKTNLMCQTNELRSDANQEQVNKRHIYVFYKTIACHGKVLSTNNIPILIFNQYSVPILIFMQ